MRDLLLALALTFLALGGSTCSSSEGKKNDAAADSGGSDGDQDCQVSGCGPDEECQQCLGANGDPVYVCVPVDSACQ